MALQWLNKEHLATIILVLAFYFFLKKKKQKPRNLNLPPTPPKHPIIGNLHQLGNMPHLSLQHLSRKYGPIMFLQLGEIPTVVISSASMANKVFNNSRKNKHALSSRPNLFSANNIFYNCTDIFFSNDEYWKKARTICIKKLLNPKKVESFGYIRKEEVFNLVERVAESYPGTTNLSRILEMYANSVISRAAFNRDFIKGGEYGKFGFQELLEEYQKLLGGFSIVEFFPSIGFVKKLTDFEVRLKVTFKRFDQFFDELVEEHQNSGKRRGDTEDLVDALLEIQRKGDFPLTMDNIKAILLDMFAAGTDTTSITLDWAMTELMMNPKVMEKAQAEIRSLEDLNERKLASQEDLPKLPYMRAIIKETFRLHPPSPLLIPRESSEDIEIDGYIIPAKTMFFINAWAIGRDPESWENPDIFEPERFIKNSKIDFRGRDFELIPFGNGDRICPGINFSIATLELALAQLLYSFDWELPPGVEPNKLDLAEAFGITMHRISPLLVIAKPYFPHRTG